MKSIRERIEANYKWVIVAICFLVVLIGLGFCSSGRSIFLAPITEALGIGRSAFTLSDSIRFLTSAIVNMFFGTMVYRFGTKKLICAGLVSLVVASVIYATAQELYLFYIAGAFYGIGFSWTTTSMAGNVINRWCKKNTGTIMGFVLGANGFGAAIASKLYTPMIYESGNPFGYRSSFWITACLVIGVLILVVLFYRERPKNAIDTPIYNSKKTSIASFDGITLKEALRMPYFYIIAFCIFFTNFILQGTYSSAAAHLKDVGLSVDFIATAVGINSIVLVFSKILCGFIFDKFGLRASFVICNIAGVVAIAALSLVGEKSWGLAAAYEVLSAVAMPLETLMIPIFAKSFFGMKEYNKFLGILVSIGSVGYAIGVPATNLVFDAFGSYVPIFIVFVCMLIAILIAFQFMINKANKLRKGQII